MFYFKVAAFCDDRRPYQVGVACAPLPAVKCLFRVDIT